MRIIDGERALRGRGAPVDVLLARPDRPRRCTLPITALRVMPPSSAAIWLADRPSDQSFLSCSTRSSLQTSVLRGLASVQLIVLFSLKPSTRPPNPEQNPSSSRGRPLG